MAYRGPLARRGDLARIKLDLTSNEILVLEPEALEVYHPYSDITDGEIKIAAYPLEEIFAEKFRALIERTRPRDVYDIINLYEKMSSKIQRSTFANCLKQKFAYKQLSLPDIGTFYRLSNKAELQSEWKNMLEHQVPNLPPLNEYWDKLDRIFSWVNKSIEEKH